jgi:hypothetical protein
VLLSDNASTKPIDQVSEEQPTQLSGKVLSIGTPAVKRIGTPAVKRKKSVTKFASQDLGEAAVNKKELLGG